MPILNRNIGADAAIDPSKINNTSSARTWSEDFDDTAGASPGPEGLYGILHRQTGATETHVLDGASHAVLDCPANNDALVLYSAATWTGRRHPKMSTRLALESVTPGVLNNVQIGWGDTAAVASTATPIADQDWAYLEFNIANSPNWRLRTRITGAAIVTVDTGVAATVAQTDFSVQVLTNGIVIAKVGATETRSAVGAITGNKSDWHWLVRIESDDAGGDDQSLTIDSIACSEARTNFTT